MPRPTALVRSTSSVCGWQCREAKNTLLFEREPRRASVMASAAAVASSSSDELAISSPVRSATMVWKFSNASRRPWEISGWYGVYAVYQAGFSRMLRSEERRVGKEVGSKLRYRWLTYP